LLAAGIDPLDQRYADRQAEAAKAADAITFAEAPRSIIAAHRAGWQNARHAAQRESTIATYAEPVIGQMACTAITTADMLAVLKPIWTAKPETASRLRGRIQQVLDSRMAQGWRNGENPSVWRGNILTGARSAEVRGAMFPKSTWNMPRGAFRPIG